MSLPPYPREGAWMGMAAMTLGLDVVARERAGVRGRTTTMSKVAESQGQKGGGGRTGELKRRATAALPPPPIPTRSLAEPRPQSDQTVDMNTGPCNWQPAGNRNS